MVKDPFHSASIYHCREGCYVAANMSYCRERFSIAAQNVRLPRQMFYRRERYSAAAKYVLLPREVFDCCVRSSPAAKDVLQPRKMFSCRERCSPAVKEILPPRKMFYCCARYSAAAKDVSLPRKMLYCCARSFAAMQDVDFFTDLLSSVFGLWLGKACVIYPLLAKDISKFGLHSPALLHMSFASQLACTHLASQRSLHNAPIFRLLLKVAVNGTHQCDFSSGIAHEPTS